MKAVLSLGFFLLGCALVCTLPFNDPKKDSARFVNHKFRELNETQYGNETVPPNQSNHTNANDTGMATGHGTFEQWNETQHGNENRLLPQLLASVQRTCILSTCALNILGEKLQQGDQTAGSSVSDPFGIGKRR